jgi:hypothetical protein
MNLFDRLFTGGLVGALPLVVLLLAGGGYLIAKRGRTALTDSPWFWAFMFSAIGLLGVNTTTGKSALRRATRRANALMRTGKAQAPRPMTRLRCKPATHPSAACRCISSPVGF